MQKLPSDRIGFLMKEFKSVWPGINFQFKVRGSMLFISSSSKNKNTIGTVRFEESQQVGAPLHVYFSNTRGMFTMPDVINELDGIGSEYKVEFGSM